MILPFRLPAIPVRLRLFTAYALLFGVLNAPLLAGIQIYTAGDSLGFNYPALQALTPFSLTGFLSDPMTGRGFPWLITYGTLDPIAHALRLVSGPAVTLAWLCTIYFVVGAWLFSLLLLRKGHAAMPAFIGGAVYAAGFYWTGDGDYPLAFSLPLLAALLLIIDSAHHRPLHALLLTMTATAYGWLAGHFNFVPIILVGSFVYACFLAWQSQGTWRYRLRPVITLIGGTAMGSAFGAIKLVPALAYLQLSERAGGLSFAAASGAGTAKLSYLYTMLFPFVHLPLVPSEVGTFFLGAAGWVAVLAGVVHGWKKRKALLLGFAFCIAVALPHSPLYWALYHLPLFSFLRAPTRWFLLAYAALGVLAADGFPLLLHDMRHGMLRFVPRLFGVLAVVAATASIGLTVLDVLWGEGIVAALQAYFDEHLFAQTSGLPLEHYHRHIVGMWRQLIDSFSLLSVRFALPFAGLLATTAMLFSRSFHEKSARARQAAWCAVFLCGLFPIFLLYHGRGDPRDIARIAALYARTPVAEGPVLPFMPAFADFLERTSVRGERTEERLPSMLGLLVPNVQALLGIESIDFYQPIQPTRMSRLLAALGSDSAPAPVEERLTLHGGSVDERVEALRKRIGLLAVLGVRHVTSIWPLPPPFRFVDSVTPAEGLKPVRIYAVPDARPFVSVERLVRIREPDEDATVAMLTGGRTQGSIIECVACAPAAGGGTARVLASGALRTDIAVEMEEDGWLVVLRPRLPGWRVQVDGKEIKTAIANSLFFGIPVTKGAHDVTLTLSYASLFADSLDRVLHKRDRFQL